MSVRLIASTGKESLFFSYCMNKKVDPEVKTIHSIIHLWNVFQVTPQFYENFSAIFQFFIHLSGHRHLISIQNYKLSYTILWQFTYKQWFFGFFFLLIENIISTLNVMVFWAHHYSCFDESLKLLFHILILWTVNHSSHKASSSSNTQSIKVTSSTI